MWENTFSDFSAQKTQDDMKHTHVKEKKRTGGGFEGFYHMFGWGSLLVFAELHSPAVPQVLKAVTT